MKDNFGFTVILVILAVLMLGGAQGSVGGILSPGPVNNEQKQSDIQRQIYDTQYKVDELKKQVALEEAKKFQSKYKDIVDIYYVNHSTDSSQEYIAVHVNYNSKEPVPVTGWTIKSLSSGATVKIPQGTYLYFTGTINSEQDIFLASNDTMYIITGISPNGASFKLNKCSGYLNQFQTFVPYISGYCPVPRNENLSAIPKTGYNDTCFDFIDRMPACRIQNDPLPPGSQKWSAECIDFIYKKVNYPACIDTHRNDKDFYQNEWRVYLKRGDTLWKNSREDIVLLDSEGKIVDEIKY